MHLPVSSDPKLSAAMGTLHGTSSSSAVRDVPQAQRFALDFRWIAFAVFLLTSIYVGYRLYQQVHGMSAGLGATGADFDTYWMTLLRVQVPVLFGGIVLVQLYLIVTRDRQIEQVEPAEELKRHFYLTMWLVVYAFTFYWTGSFFAEADGSWHQAVLRDTPFTPSHIVLFYACIPLYLLCGIGSFVYGMTRIPAFSRGISVMHAFAVMGPLLILPNLGFNEWGHAYWLTEEIISHPLHWGFVLLVWNALAFAGITLQIATRMRELFPIVFAHDTPAVA